jgi:hypothetical protein
VVNFMQAPGAFFTTFQSGGPGPAGWGEEGGGSQGDVIDAEVVEDDERHGPPGLHAPR